DYKVTGVQTCALPIYYCINSTAIQGNSFLATGRRIATDDLWNRSHITVFISRIFAFRRKRQMKIYTRLHFRFFLQDSSQILLRRSEERRVGKECSPWW